MTPTFQGIRREEMGDLGVEMEERVVAMNATGSKTRKIKILDKQVVVVAKTNMGHK